MTVGQLRRVFSFFFFWLLVSFILCIICSSFSVIRGETQSSSVTLDFILIVEAVLRTIGSSFLTFALLFFTVQWLRPSVRHKIGTVEISLITILLVFSIIPGFSVYGTVLAWFGVASYVNTKSDYYNGEFAVIQSQLFRDSEYSFVLSSVFSALSIVLLWLIQFVLIDVQAYTRGLKDEDFQDPVVQKIPKPDGENFEYLHHQLETQSRLRQINNIKSDVENRFASCSRFGAVYALLVSYFVALVATMLIYRYHMSYVPFVGLITLIRVCSANSANFAPQVLQFANNVTVYLHSNVSPLYSMCSAAQPVNTPFSIAVCVGVFFVLDLVLLFKLLRALPLARVHLASFPYMTTRNRFLGFIYFRYLTKWAFVFAFLTAVIATSVLPLPLYMVYEASGQGTNFTAFISPMFHVGITSGGLEFGPVFVILATWLLVLCFGNLPSENAGCCGWFRQRGDHTGMECLLQPGLRQSGLDEDQEEEEHVARFICYERDIELILEAQFPETRGPVEKPLEEQIRSGVVCIESLVQMYHYMSLAYDMTEKDRTMEDQQKMLEDPAFRLGGYFSDAETDTHCFVFFSDTVVVVAFRGSVSMTNYRTDYDSAELVFGPALHIRPRVGEEFGNLTYARQVAAKMPMAHRGFLVAYETVKAALRARVGELLVEMPSRVVMVTGHSLGGGLAIVSAFDLAVHHRIPPSQISLTTFGCPMAGNLSFCTRFHRVVPCAHRVVTANDVITKLPLQNPGKEFTLNCWFHVGSQILLMPNGNAIINPSPIELYMVHSSTSVTAHFRLSYATSLAAWAIRANQMHAPWWSSEIFQLFHYADFSPIPRSIRDALLWDLRRPGVPYLLGDVMYRDMAVDTESWTTKAEELEPVEQQLRVLVGQALVRSDTRTKLFSAMKLYIEEFERENYHAVEKDRVEAAVGALQPPSVLQRIGHAGGDALRGAIEAFRGHEPSPLTSDLSERFPGTEEANV